MKIFSTICFFIISAALISAQPKNQPTWKAELDNDVKQFTALQNGKYIFMQVKGYAYLYQPESGRKVWSKKIKGYEEKAIHTLLNDSLYLVSDGDSLKCFGIFNDTVYWKRAYQKIDQEDFVNLKHLDTIVVIRYAKYEVGINLLTGRELWRTMVKYTSSFEEYGSANYLLFKRQNKLLTFGNDDDISLFDVVTGKQLLRLTNVEVNMDLVKQKRTWNYISDGEHYAAIILSKGLLVINIDSAKQVIKIDQIKINEDYNVLIPTSLGCALAGKEKFVLCNFSTGSSIQVPVDVDLIRNYAEIKPDSITVLLLSIENRLVGIDISHNRILWETKKEMGSFTGFVFNVIAQDTNNLVVTYANPNKGVALSLMSINVLTGEMFYKTPIALSTESLPDVKTPLPVQLNASTKETISFGYTHLGFDFSQSLYSDIATFFIVTKTEMKEPKIRRQGGEGIVKINIKTGDEVMNNYLKIAEDLDFKGGIQNLAKPFHAGSLTFIAGEKKVVALNTINGEVHWAVTEKQLDGGYVFDMSIVDGFLYLKTGAIKYKFIENKKEKDKKKKGPEQKIDFEEDTYAILAVDTSDGKILWRKKLKADPALFASEFSINNYMNSDSTTLVMADEKNLFALKINATSAGTIAWNFELSDSGAGKLKVDDLFRPTEVLQSSTLDGQHSSTFYTPQPVHLESIVKNENIFSKVILQNLFVTYSKQDSQIIIFGEDGIISVNPSNGHRMWKHEWDFSADDIYYPPTFIGNYIFYFIDGKMVLVNRKNGKTIWQVKADKEQAIFILPNQSAIVTVLKDEVAGFKVPSE